MNETIITVENLGKRYSLRHQRDQRYVALRDVIAEKAKNLFRRNGRKKPTSDVRPPTSDLRAPSSQLPAPSSSREDFWALRDVSFEVRRGEVLGIIGRNGAGKTTLLKILSRITEPTEGRVRIKGRVASLLEVGTGFHPELTGRENIYLNGAILGMTKGEIREKFDEIVAFAETEKFLDTPVKHYSSGMYVRLAFAVAAHLEPEILIVDEVLAVGDLQFQKKCLGKMQEVSATAKRTVLFVSHNMGAVRFLCSRVIWMDMGQIRMVGTVPETLEEYLAATISSSPRSLGTSNAVRMAGLGEAARITQISLNEGSSVKSWDRLVVDFEVLVQRNVEEASFGIGFSMVDGTRLLTLDSDLGGIRIPLYAGTTKSVRLVLQSLPLEPATYMIDIGIRSGNSYQVDYLGSAFAVAIQPGVNTPSFLVDNRSPGIRLAAEWTL